MTSHAARLLAGWLARSAARSIAQNMTAVSISAGSGALSIRCVMRVTPVLYHGCLGQVMACVVRNGVRLP